MFVKLASISATGSHTWLTTTSPDDRRVQRPESTPLMSPYLRKHESIFRSGSIFIGISVYALYRKAVAASCRSSAAFLIRRVGNLPRTLIYHPLGFSAAPALRVCGLSYLSEPLSSPLQNCSALGYKRGKYYIRLLLPSFLGSLKIYHDI